MLGWLQFFRTLQVIFRALPVSNVPKLTIMSLRAVLTFGSVLRYGGYVLLRAWQIISVRKGCVPPCDTTLLFLHHLDVEWTRNLHCDRRPGGCTDTAFQLVTQQTVVTKKLGVLGDTTESTPS